MFGAIHVVTLVNVVTYRMLWQLTLLLLLLLLLSFFFV
jgi:hypothetical protein